MSNETKDIGEIVKKSKILLLDIEGTTTSISFVKDQLFPYVEKHLQGFLEGHWEVEQVQEAVAALRQLALEDKEKSVEGVVDIPGEDAEKNVQIEGLVSNVKWQMSLDRKTGALKQLQGLIWLLGYDKGEIKGHVYEDVPAAIELWRSTEGNKVYIYSSASVKAQKLLFAKSCVGDMLNVIDGFFDTNVGGKREKESYTAIVEKIGCKADEVLFLTDILEEAEAARAAGLQAGVVARGDSPPSAAPASAAAAGLPVLRSLAQLALSNKRKPDHQDEAPASKVAKTNAEVDPKTAIEKSESSETEPVAESISEEKAVVAEKMDVEDGVEVATEAVDKPMLVDETVVEDITETSEPVDAPEINLEPVVTEVKIDEKTDDPLTEKSPENMEAKNIDALPNPTFNGEKTTVEDKTVITEIEDVTDKHVPSEIIENIVPIVEEPSVEMEELQNVGEVLEKECDEILSKVQDVTNLDSIPIKPMLNTIAEEAMEAENTDSNDIVDKILDTEMEMGLKQSSEDESKVAETKITQTTEESASKTSSTTSDEKKDSEVTTEIDNKSSETDKTNGTVESVPNTEEKEKTDKPNIVSETVIEKETSTTPAEQNDKPADEIKESSTSEENSKEPHVNGKASNGETISLNGNAKDEELNDRLTVENGSKVNGSNGDANEKNGAADKPTDVVEIKTKPVPAVEETRAEPIEQVTEA